MGAAEDGRAPTEELSCVAGWDFRSMGFYVRTGGLSVNGRAER